MENDISSLFDEREGSEFGIFRPAIEMTCVAAAIRMNNNVYLEAAQQLATQEAEKPYYSGFTVLPTIGMTVDEVQQIAHIIGPLEAMGDRWNGDLILGSAAGRLAPLKFDLPAKYKVLDFLADLVLFNADSSTNFHQILTAFPQVTIQTEDLDYALQMKKLGFNAAFEYLPFYQPKLSFDEVIQTALENDLTLIVDTGHIRHMRNTTGVSLPTSPTLQKAKWQLGFEAIMEKPQIKKIIHFQGHRDMDINGKGEFLDTIAGSKTTELNEMMVFIAKKSLPDQLVVVEMSPTMRRQAFGDIAPDIEHAKAAATYLRSFYVKL